MYFAMTGKNPGGAPAVKVEPSAIKKEASAVKEEPSSVKVEASAINVEASAVKVKEETLTPVQVELKAEPCQAKGGLYQVKQEPVKHEHSCLTSPARILDLYKVNRSPADNPTKKCKVDLHVWIYMYICIYVFYMCGYIYVYICIYVYMYICMHVYMHICIYV